IIIFGSELQGADIAALVKSGSVANAKFICLGDYANSRGAADMGLYPDLLPGYVAIDGPHKYNEEWGSLSKTKGLSLQEMLQAAKAGKLSALYVVGSNPVVDYNFDPAALQDTFVVVQELFLTETAMLAEVVLQIGRASCRERRAVS